MKILLSHPGETPYLAEIANDSTAFHHILGSPIRVSYPFDDDIAVLYNGNGLNQNLPANCLFPDFNLPEGEGLLVCGTLLLCSTSKSSSHLFESLTEDQISLCLDCLGKNSLKFAPSSSGPTCYVSLDEDTVVTIAPNTSS